ncbi:hypothetical protein Trydic_g5343 [Trypoxylus dichotomus]
MQRRLRKVNSLRQLYLWEASLEKGGTQRGKSTAISQYVVETLEDVDEVNTIIPDINIRKWALEANEDIKVRNFRA